MGKRFTETTKWRDRWFAQLSARHKLAWIYLCDNCDNAGVCEIVPHIARAELGEDLDWDSFVDASSGRVERLSEDKLWLTRFVEFQYGELSWDCAAHRQVIRLIEKHQLSERVPEGIRKGSRTLEDKDKDKDKDRDRTKSKVKPTLAQVREYCEQRKSEGKPPVDPESFFDFYEANGWVQGRSGKPIKDWRACVRTWERSDSTRGSPEKPKFDPRSAFTPEELSQ